MPNIPKPELERGNYITYADEPGTVYEPDSGDGGGEGGGGDGGDGGSGTAVLLAPYGDSGMEPQFSFNQVKAFVDANTPVFIKSETVTADDGEISILQVCGIDWTEGGSYNVQIINTTGGTITLTSSDPDVNMVTVTG